MFSKERVHYPVLNNVTRSMPSLDFSSTLSKQTKNPKKSCKEKLPVDHILFNCQLMKSCFLDGHLLGIYMYLYKMFSWKIFDQFFLGLSPDNPIVSLFEYMPFRVYECVNVCACMWSCAHEL